MFRTTALIVCLGSLAAWPAAWAQTLDIYLIDVEGGGATLIVTPERQSILVDSGWRRDDGRDVQRIVHVLKDVAKLSEIDYLVTTHFHRDHYGSALRLSGLVPIRTFLDRGPIMALKEDPQFTVLYTEYMEANKGLRETVRAGDELPLKQGKIPVRMRCVASDRKIVTGASGDNAECREQKKAKDDPSDNASSLAFVVSYGAFDFFHGADLTWDVEAELVCPSNQVGKVDAYQVDHHGFKVSNNPVLLRSIQPSVALMANGDQKGCDPEVVALLRSLPDFEDLYQLHKNLKTGDAKNTAPDFIANLEPEASCTGHWIRLSANASDSVFTVTNSRNDLTKSYKIK